MQQLTTSEQLDHLAKLADDRWREYALKVDSEWKLSYAIWATQAAAIAGLLTKGDDIAIPRSHLVAGALVFGLVVLGIHATHHYWIQVKLGLLRSQMVAVFESRVALLGLKAASTSPRGAPWKQLSFMVQLFITLVLAALLLWGASVLPIKQLAS